MYLKYTRFFAQNTQDMTPAPQRLAEDTEERMNRSGRDGKDDK